jgi:hypothetical protein
MERCLDCNSLLLKDETVCMECGTKVGGDEANAMDVVSGIVTLLFYVSFAATLTSPFLSRGPSFMLCLLTTCALLFVMRTAKESTAKVRKR